MTTASPSAGRPEQDRPGSDSWAEQVQSMDADDLRLLATSLPVIEQAKGILMGHYGCDAPTAFAILGRWSSAQRLKLRDVAATLVHEASREEPEQPDGQRSRAVERFLRTHGLA